MKPAAYFLVGCTAAGKTAVGHQLALEMGAEILCADSMTVYRGLDVGTAKPTPRERAEISYRGLDLVAPDQEFNAGLFQACAREALAQATRPVLVVGGSGLYIKSLTRGLAPLPPVQPELRARAAALWRDGGVPALREALRAVNPPPALRPGDLENPRRLMRALELAWQGVAPPDTWAAGPAPMLVGLRLPAPLLQARIRRRVQAMYDQGLLEETAALRRQYPAWSETARHAIGYAEALGVLDHRLSRAQAMEQTVARTRQLAKRQMTWFRRQEQVAWVDVADPLNMEQAVRQVRQLWEEYGPAPVRCGS